MTDHARPALNPSALSIDDAAKLLARASGEPFAAADLQSDVARGAPANADGTINLVHYAAWLARELARG